MSKSVGSTSDRELLQSALDRLEVDADPECDECPNRIRVWSREFTVFGDGKDLQSAKQDLNESLLEVFDVYVDEGISNLGHSLAQEFLLMQKLITDEREASVMVDS